eukprot:UN01050
MDFKNNPHGVVRHVWKCRMLWQLLEALGTLMRVLCLGNADIH